LTAIHESKDIGNRLNAAYTNNLVYKDSFGTGNGGNTVDMKRVLDLSPERIDAIKTADPTIGQEIGEELDTALDFWQNCAQHVTPKLIEALVSAIGSPDVATDAHCNYRCVDYYSRTVDIFDKDSTPRCGEHRDFGTFTLIFADKPGLEIYHDNNWVAVPVQAPGTAIMVFGWCTEIRSNGRVTAVKHRVVDPKPDAHGVTPRRTTAVLFVAPKNVNTPLEPVVLYGETRQYISGVKVGQLRNDMARKWRYREGTLSPEDKMLEEEEIRAKNLFTQDDVVQRNVAAISVAQ
jgi:isopenicillin N synthase-like dioxygenase